MSPPRSDPPPDDRPLTLAIARDDLLHAALAQAQAGIAIFDTAGRFIYVNRLMAHLNGQAVEAHLGRTLHEVIPDLAANVEPSLKRALHGDRTVEQLSSPAPDAPSEVRTWEIEYTPLRDEHGHIVGATNVVRDRTQIHDAERRISEAYARLEAVFDTAPVSLSVWDRDLHLVAANERMQRWNNIDPARALGRTLAEIAPTWRDGPVNLRRALHGERLSAEIDRRALGNEDGPAHVQAWYAPVRLAGEVIGAVVASIDISARVEHERSVDAAYAELEAVFAATPVALAMWDRDLRLVHANERWHDWTGVPNGSSAVRATDLGGTEHELIRERFRRAFAGEHFTVESNRRKRGLPLGPAWADISYAPVELNGTIVGVVVVTVDITERVEHQRVLDEAYAELEAVFDNVPVGIAVFDRDFRIVHINDRIARWNNVDAASSVGRPGAEVFTAIWSASEQYRHRALGGEPCEFETDRRNGGAATGPSHVLVTYTPVVVDGKAIGIVASSTDISERVEYTRALDEAYAQLASIFDSVPVGITVYDRDLRVIRMNEEMARWIGVDRTTAIGRPGAELFAPTWSLNTAQRAHALAGEPVQFEVDRRAAGAMTGPANILVSYSPIMINGEVIGLSVSSTDISERVESTRALDEAYAQLAAIFDNVPVGIAVYDRDLRIVRINEEMARWNGIDQAAAVGRLGEELFGPQWPLAMPLRQRALAGESVRIEVDRHTAGQMLGPAHVLASYTPVVVDGEVIGVTVSSSDISESVERTRALAEAYGQMEAVFSASPVALSLWDAEMRLVRGNARWREWNDVPLDGTVTLADVSGPMIDAVQERFRRALAGERFTVEADRRTRARTTGPRWAEVSYAPRRGGRRSRRRRHYRHRHHGAGRARANAAGSVRAAGGSVRQRPGRHRRLRPRLPHRPHEPPDGRLERLRPGQRRRPHGSRGTQPGVAACRGSDAPCDGGRDDPDRARPPRCRAALRSRARAGAVLPGARRRRGDRHHQFRDRHHRTRRGSPPRRGGDRVPRRPALDRLARAAHAAHQHHRLRRAAGAHRSTRARTITPCRRRGSRIDPRRVGAHGTHPRPAPRPRRPRCRCR